MIRIGVSGHRFLADIPKLQAGIDQALARIERIDPADAWSVLSSLAEGADRLVVERILAHRPSTRLIVPLPLKAEDFETDFSTAESRAEFRRWLARAVETIEMPTAASRAAAYRAAGEYLIRRADLLIAVWDGQSARGKGGTGEVVAFARQRKLPIAWVHAGNRSPENGEPTSLGQEQGAVTFEGF